MLVNKKGFTIIELLIVIAIIGLLATISIVALNGARQKGRDAKRVVDIRQVQIALDLYFDDNNAYPVTATSLVLGSTAAAKLCNGGFVPTSTSCTKTYMNMVPSNPTPGGSAYTYAITTGATYTIGFSLEEATAGLTSGAHTVNENGMQ